MKNIFKTIIIAAFIFLLSITSFANSEETEGFQYNNVYETQRPVKIENVEAEVAQVYRNLLPTINKLAEGFITKFFEDDYIDQDNLDKLLSGLDLNKSRMFAKDLFDKSKNLGNFKEISDTQVVYVDGAYETIMVLKFEEGNLTVNLSHDKTLPYIMFATYNNINTEEYLLDKAANNTIFSDYYISNGINLNQVSGIRAFAKRLKIFVIVLLIIIIIYNAYGLVSKKNNSNSNVGSTDNKAVSAANDNSHLNAVIAAAIAAYEEDKNSSNINNKIYVKTIKKTNWKKK